MYVSISYPNDNRRGDSRGLQHGIRRGIRGGRSLWAYGRAAVSIRRRVQGGFQPQRSGTEFHKYRAKRRVPAGRLLQGHTPPGRFPQSSGLRVDLRDRIFLARGIDRVRGQPWFHRSGCGRRVCRVHLRHNSVSDQCRNRPFHRGNYLVAAIPALCQAYSGLHRG